MCLCSAAAWAETETFGTGEVNKATLMVGDRVDVTYTGRTPQGRANIEEAIGTVVQVDESSFAIDADRTEGSNQTPEAQTVTVQYERIIRLDRRREVFWALDTSDLRISEGEFVAKYLGNNELTGLEGMWVWEDRSFELIFVKDESDRIKRFDYVGLVLATDRPGWRMGEIKMLIKKTAKNGTYSAVFVTGKKEKFNTMVVIQDEREILALLPNEVQSTRLEKRHIFKTYPVPDDAGEPKAKTVEVRAGSGFFVTGEIIATANHLVEGSEKIEVRIGGKRVRAIVRSRDKRNNLALLSIATEDRGVLSELSIIPLILGEPQQTMEGERGVASGYVSIDAPRPSVSEGIVNSLFGPDEDLTRFTISAAVGQTEAGGPLIDQSNRVIGILMPPDSNSVRPVQVALKAGLLRSLLRMSGVTDTVQEPSSPTETLDTSLISQMARSAVVTIVAR